MEILFIQASICFKYEYKTLLRGNKGGLYSRNVKDAWLKRSRGDIDNLTQKPKSQLPPSRPPCLSICPTLSVSLWQKLRVAACVPASLWEELLLAGGAQALENVVHGPSCDLSAARLVRCHTVRRWVGLAASDQWVTAVATLSPPQNQTPVWPFFYSMIPVIAPHPKKKEKKNSFILLRAQSDCVVESASSIMWLSLFLSLFFLKDCLLQTLYLWRILCREEDTQGNVLGSLFFHSLFSLTRIYTGSYILWTSLLTKILSL